MQVQKLLGGTLSLSDHNAKISETYGMIKVCKYADRVRYV
ncbi:hypothetical protein BTN50_1555 [Candidatus Enterovibrio altilux]|uniref:Mobile element protein n=1 Tax=Candidatus Enterovibrio altilux TaxID=1927128 RepID=A0A291BAI4_9GAMM|nr:hypothetical protein BTN50_1555 [Candidatus Enterovibrio luxaltus]